VPASKKGNQHQQPLNNRGGKGPSRVKRRVRGDQGLVQPTAVKRGCGGVLIVELPWNEHELKKKNSERCKFMKKGRRERRRTNP